MDEKQILSKLFFPSQAPSVEEKVFGIFIETKNRNAVIFSLSLSLFPSQKQSTEI